MLPDSLGALGGMLVFERMGANAVDRGIVPGWTTEGVHVESEAEGRVDLEKMRRAYDASRERAGEMPVLTQRAVARIDRDMHMVGRIGRFDIESDEPPERGGEDLAPAPLQYIVAGAAF